MKIQGSAASRRTDERRRFQCFAFVSWQTDSGENKLARVEIMDLSMQGAGIVSREPIAAQTMVYLQAPGYGPIGNASVRYCARSGVRYRIGLLFTAPSRLADAARQKYLDQRALQSVAGTAPQFSKQPQRLSARQTHQPY